MKIGADELILWLRKNGIAAAKDTVTLGKQILPIMEKLGGKKIEDDSPAYWSFSDAAVNPLGLPKTSAQYELDAAQLPELYRLLAGL